MTVPCTKMLICTLALLLSATQAKAQEPPAFDLSGGYSLVRRRAALEKANFHGWLASVTAHRTNWLAIVGEVGGNYTTMTDLVMLTLKSITHTYMAGGRLTLRGSTISPFAQVLVGAARHATSGSEAGLGEVPGLKVARTQFQIQPGGGVDVRLSPRLGLRTGVDYGLRGLKGLRLHAGVALGLGGR